MSKDLEVKQVHWWTHVVVPDSVRLPAYQRPPEGWDRDATAGAIAIARWEDDGGRPAGINSALAVASLKRLGLRDGNRDI